MPEKPSTKPLLDKLGVKHGSRVCVIGVSDQAFVELLQERTGDVAIGRPRKDTDLIFFQADSREKLERLKALKAWLVPEGGIWVVRPKGVPDRISEADVISAGKASGLVDNKVVAFSATHTAERLVIPVALR